eukprot:UN23780
MDIFFWNNEYPTCCLVLGSKYSYVLPFYYTVKYPILIGYRLYTYYYQNWQWFLLDLCYYINTGLLLYLWIFNDNKYMFVVLFSLISNMLWAVIVFGNALVFHSIDHTTSLLIHITPNLIMYSIRWDNEPHKEEWQHPGWTTCDLRDDDCNNAFYLILVPMICLVLFQIQYLIIFRCIFVRYVDDNPKAMNTFKWLTRKKE